MTSRVFAPTQRQKHRTVSCCCASSIWRPACVTYVTYVTRRFVLLLFYFQLVRPYAPFQSFYVALLLVQWAGEGIGQLISIQINASRQIAVRV